jgi:hypothetical protein
LILSAQFTGETWDFMRPDFDDINTIGEQGEKLSDLIRFHDGLLLLRRRTGRNGGIDGLLQTKENAITN